jgi:hypothetical protein
LVYLTYVALCNQVQPGGPVKWFDSIFSFS